MFSRLLAILLGLSLFGVAPACAPADDEAPPTKQTEQNTAADSDSAGEKADGEAAPADPYAVPEGSNEELLAFIETMRKMRPTGNSRDEMIASFKKLLHAMTKAADKVLANEPDAEAKSAAVQAKLEGLNKLTSLGDPGSQEALHKFAVEVQSGDDEALAKLANSLLLQLRVRKLMTGNTEGAQELLDEVTAQVKADPDDTEAVRLAMRIGQALEYSGKTDLAVQAYKSFAELMAKSGNEEVKRHAAKLEGIVRRLELVGHPMEISGTLLDGKPFDPETLKGKVVLVDFWATWCGPCIAEMPNVLSNYEKYHAKGFDVIGISLDDDRAALEKFVKDRELPWPILFEDGDGTRGWENPLAQKYGIQGIPTVILIGADGNVVSLHARGGELGKLLLEKLGPPAENAATKKADDKADVSDE